MDQQSTINFNEAEQRKVDGIAQSYDHAEAKIPGWADRALEFIKSFPGPVFMAEDVRKYAYDNGLEFPPHERAWGGVICTARRLNIIHSMGYAKVSNPAAHKTPATLWGKN